MFALQNFAITGDIMAYVEERWPKLIPYDRLVLLEEVEKFCEARNIRGLEVYIARKKEAAEEDVAAQTEGINALFAFLRGE